MQLEIKIQLENQKYNWKIYTKIQLEIYTKSKYNQNTIGKTYKTIKDSF